MNTKKINTINWWSDDARMTPNIQPENNSVADMNNMQSNMYQNQMDASNYQGQAYPGQQLPPVVQPLVVVPYSTTMRPLDGISADGDGTYFEDIYGNEEQQGVESKKAKRLAARVFESDVKGIYVKKRPAALIVIAVFAFIIILAAALGALVPAISGYVSILNVTESGETSGISMLDPVISFAQTVFGIDFAEMGLPNEFVGYINMESEDILVTIASIALPVAILIYVILALSALIAAIIGLICKARETKGFAKIKLGVVSIIMFVCALLTVVGGFALTGGKLAEIMSFISGGTVTIGYGIYAMIVVPIIIFICSCCGYKKNK